MTELLSLSLEIQDGGLGKLFLKGKFPSVLLLWISSYQSQGARFSLSVGNRNQGSHAGQSKNFFK